MCQNPTHLLFVIPAEGQPRHWRRVTRAEELNIRVQTVGFIRERGLHESSRRPAIVLGKAVDGAYAVRVVSYLRSLIRLRRALRCANASYAFGLDMAALCLLARVGRKRTPIYLEVGDIRRYQLRGGLTGYLMRSLERLIVQTSERVIVTSEAFLEDYFIGLRGLDTVKTKALVVHNAPSSPGGNSPDFHRQTEVRTEELAVGWFGLIRCEKTLRALLRWVLNGPDKRRLHLAGTLQLSDRQLTSLIAGEAITGVHYSGPYCNPEDLPRLYGSVDLVWSAYPLDDEEPGNWQWARTNRYFEALHHGVPPIARNGTPDGHESARRAFGPVLAQEASEDEIAQSLAGLVRRDVRVWEDNIANAMPEFHDSYRKAQLQLEILFEEAASTGGHSRSQD